MASLIDDKIYELITKSENFEFAYDISGRFEYIKERLYLEFWDEFQKKLRLKNIDFNLDTYGSWGIMFYHPKWHIFKFYFDLNGSFMEIGIGTNNGSYKHHYPKFGDVLKTVLPDYNLLSESNELWFYLKCNDDMYSLQGLKRLLPENREQIINEYYMMFCSLREIISDTIVELEEDCKMLGV